MSGYFAPSSAGDRLVRHGQLVGGGRHVPGHGLPQVMIMIKAEMDFRFSSESSVSTPPPSFSLSSRWIGQ